MTQSNKKYFLFIPFSATENSFMLYMKAMDWRIALKRHQRLEKLPEILMYRQEDETDADYTNYDNVHFALPPQNSSSETIIYILAHGFGDKEFVCSGDSQLHDKEDCYLPIQLVAKRLQSMGFTPELATHAKLKLYTCNEKGNATLHLATKLGQSLGPDYQNLPLDYYSAILFTPNILSGKKTAVVRIDLPDEVIEDAGELKQFKHILYQDNGKPKQSRDTITVAETLAKKTELTSQEAKLSIESNRAIDIAALPPTLVDLSQQLACNTMITFFKPPQAEEQRMEMTSKALTYSG